MSPIDYVKMPLVRYADFSGRSRRLEYWIFVLGILGATIVAGLVDGLLGMVGMIGGVYGPMVTIVILGSFIPLLACVVRRLHDQNRPGWLLLLVIVPHAIFLVQLKSGSLALGGAIWMLCGVSALGMLVLMFLEGTKGDNQYGPDPKAGAA